ncbi:LysR substrate-binding domain-containing protein [Spirulina sp. 06S082]|uniref:LysR substrate-binding domain-containing protein n=1 Tax=Spirulina sp. 06S082 TaxID=3110248 RepID=UPI002B21216C|nr:LysR substrate-binding domain-containing protein [Spirulina sp. 06S082]MEA5471175.1 LysR substrate-binding domain-containing protein [Spirulina sp. 06S082]
MPDLNAMVVFARVVEQGSFVGAARQLNLPKATVSRRIQQLEEVLQVQLLERSTRVVRPTEIGQIYYEYCDRIVAEMEEANTAIAEQKSEPTGILRVSAPSAFTHLFLKSLIPDFLFSYPKISLNLEITNQGVNPLREGFDLSIRVGTLADSSLKIQPFGEAKVQLFASSQYLDRKGIPQSPHELSQHDTIATGISRGQHYLWKLINPDKQQEISHTPRCTVNDPIVAYELVLAGIGIGLLPFFYCVEAVESGQLIPLLLSWQSTPVLLSAVYPTTKERSPKVKVFLQFLREKLNTYQL